MYLTNSQPPEIVNLIKVDCKGDTKVDYAITDMSATAVGAIAVTAGGGYLLLRVAMRPASQLLGHTIVAGLDPNEVCLTYDDGPTEWNTMAILEVLAKHKVRATFFMVGRNVKQNPNVARSVLDAGHLIGNHTMNHTKLIHCRPAEVRSELSQCGKIIEDTLGCAVRYFRPPHGKRSPGVLRTAYDLGLLPVMWNVTCYDWNPIGSKAIRHYAERGISRNQLKGCGSNILLHDGAQAVLAGEKFSTAEATDALLRGYAADSQVRYVTPETWDKQRREFDQSRSEVWP